MHTVLKRFYWILLPRDSNCVKMFLDGRLDELTEYCSKNMNALRIQQCASPVTNMVPVRVRESASVSV
eukprot:6202072-Pleurochrysis_carterae.AAC.1